MAKVKKVAVLTFTYHNDAHIALCLHSNVPTHFVGSNGVNVEIEKVIVIESKHRKLEQVFDDCKIIVADFPRGSGLSGIPAVYAMSNIYSQLLNEYDFILKLDSDSIIYDWDFVLNSIAHDVETVGIFRERNEYHFRAVNGCFYGFGKFALPVLNDQELMLQCVRELPAEKIPEDIFFSRLFLNLDYNYTNVNKRKTFMCSKPYRGADILFGHFGYISYETLAEELKTIDEARGKDSGITLEKLKEVRNNVKNLFPELEFIDNIDRYDRKGTIISPVPSGSVVAGYDENGNIVWDKPKQVAVRQGLLPYPKWYMEKFKIKPIGQV